MEILTVWCVGGFLGLGIAFSGLLIGINFILDGE